MSICLRESSTGTTVSCARPTDFDPRRNILDRWLRLGPEMVCSNVQGPSFRQLLLASGCPEADARHRPNLVRTDITAELSPIDGLPLVNPPLLAGSRHPARDLSRSKADVRTRPSVFADTLCAALHRPLFSDVSSCDEDRDSGIFESHEVFQLVTAGKSL